VNSIGNGILTLCGDPLCVSIAIDAGKTHNQNFLDYILPTSDPDLPRSCSRQLGRNRRSTRCRALRRLEQSRNCTKGRCWFRSLRAITIPLRSWSRHSDLNGRK
jgi:hypothetical protein